MRSNRFQFLEALNLFISTDDALCSEGSIALGVSVSYANSNINIADEG